MRTRGFTLVEALIVLGLSLLVFLAAFEFFGLSRSFFYELKGAQEDNLAVQAALDKLRIDLLRAGCGLELAIRCGAVDGVTAAGSLVILSQETAYSLVADCAAGDNRLSLEKTSGLSAGRIVCLADEDKAERHVIAAVEADAIALSEPLQDHYLGSESRLLLLEEVTYFLDEAASILRRKVNASPAQPLLDSAGLFEFAYLEEDNLVRVRLADKKDMERAHELSVFPKNLGLVLE